MTGPTPTAAGPHPSPSMVPFQPFQQPAPCGWCSQGPAQMWRGRAQSRRRCDGVDAHNRAEQDGERPTRLERDRHPLRTRAEQHAERASETATDGERALCLVRDPRTPECEDIPLLQREVGALEACAAKSAAETTEPCAASGRGKWRSDHDKAECPRRSEHHAVCERCVRKRSAADVLSRADAGCGHRDCSEGCALHRMRGSRARLGRSP